jgi:DNA polymerase-4/DNA polymerase V
MKNSLILHIDGDAFFASCEVSRRPDLKGKPVVVGEEKGIACALTYEAKKLGIYRGMPIFQIRKEYPQVTVIASHFDLYEEFQRKLLSILRSYLPKVEPYSIDECFATVPDMPRSDLEEFVKKLKTKVQSSLGVTYSFGIAATKTLAKVASKRNKPNGCVFLTSEREVKEALRDTPAGAVWGLGRKLSAALLGQNIKTAEEFVSMPLKKLEDLFSLPVEETYHELRGVRIFEVREGSEDQKTIQATRSLQKATTDAAFLFSELSRNVETACQHLRDAKLLTNAVHAFYRHADNGRHRESDATLLPFYTDDPKVILKALKPLVAKIYEPGLRYKSTGLTLLNLKREENIQEDLFGIQKEHVKEKTYLETIDTLNRKFGSWSVMHASSLRSVLKRREESKDRDKRDNYECGLPFPYMGEVY